jgi:putative sigma-54 modulation protein
MKATIHSIHFDADKKLLDLINKKVDKLEQFSDNVIGAEVFLRIEKDTEERENKLVEIKLYVPGKDHFAAKRAKSFEEATDNAVEALRRQVLKAKAKHS